MFCRLDVLRDEGLQYAEKLKAAGIPVQVKVFAGTVNFFASFSTLTGTLHARLLAAALLLLHSSETLTIPLLNPHSTFN